MTLRSFNAEVTDPKAPNNDYALRVIQQNHDHFTDYSRSHHMHFQPNKMLSKLFHRRLWNAKLNHVIPVQALELAHQNELELRATLEKIKCQEMRIEREKYDENQRILASQLAEAGKKKGNKSAETGKKKKSKKKSKKAEIVPPIVHSEMVLDIEKEFKEIQDEYYAEIIDRMSPDHLNLQEDEVRRLHIIH